MTCVDTAGAVHAVQAHRVYLSLIPDLLGARGVVLGRMIDFMNEQFDVTETPQVKGRPAERSLPACCYIPCT